MIQNGSPRRSEPFRTNDREGQAFERPTGFTASRLWSLHRGVILISTRRHTDEKHI
jgi:hypothetical protein